MNRTEQAMDLEILFLWIKLEGSMRQKKNHAPQSSNCTRAAPVLIQPAAAAAAAVSAAAAVVAAVRAAPVTNAATTISGPNENLILVCLSTLTVKC